MNMTVWSHLFRQACLPSSVCVCVSLLIFHRAFSISNTFSARLIIHTWIFIIYWTLLVPVWFKVRVSSLQLVKRYWRLSHTCWDVQSHAASVGGLKSQSAQQHRGIKQRGQWESYYLSWTNWASPKLNWYTIKSLMRPFQMQPVMHSVLSTE